ncbi:unnamed protein product, partial [Ixodes hexagonus]
MPPPRRARRAALNWVAATRCVKAARIVRAPPSSSQARGVCCCELVAARARASDRHRLRHRTTPAVETRASTSWVRAAPERSRGRRRRRRRRRLREGTPPLDAGTDRPAGRHSPRTP